MNPNAPSFNFNPGASGFVPRWAVPPQAQGGQRPPAGPGGQHAPPQPPYGQYNAAYGQPPQQGGFAGYPYGGPQGGYPYGGGYPQQQPYQQHPSQPSAPAAPAQPFERKPVDDAAPAPAPPPTISLSIGGSKLPAPAPAPASPKEENVKPATISLSIGGSKPKPTASPAPTSPAPKKADVPATPASSSSAPSKPSTPAPAAAPAAPKAAAPAAAAPVASASKGASKSAAAPSKAAIAAAQAKADQILRETSAAADEETLKDLFGTDGAVPKQHLNIVFCGHVDAGKSTMGGQLLYLTGMVDKRTMEKYERDAKEAGRESWYLSWALDSTPQERAKGKTVEVGRAYFETSTRRYTILDAPGHKTFVPSMISGAAQADVAVLVISARKGEFETGFEKGGQTREHAMLVKTAGVQKLIVVVNKMDDPTVRWDKARYDEIHDKLTPFLRGTGFNPKTDITYIPVSAYTGANLKEVVKKADAPWYDGPALIPFLDAMPIVDRKISAPLMMPISDKYKDMGTIVVGKIESGKLRVNDKLMLMPNKEIVEVQAIENEMEEETQVALCGDNVRIRLRGVEDEAVQPGFVLTDPSKPVKTVRQFEAQLAILDHKNIICAGYSAVMHIHTAAEEITLSALLHYYDKKTGRKSKKPPQFAKKGQKIVALIEATGAICMERFADYPQLGRFTLRDEGKTIAIGKVTKLIAQTETGELADVSTGVQDAVAALSIQE